MHFDERKEKKENDFFFSFIFKALCLLRIFVFIEGKFQLCSLYQFFFFLDRTMMKIWLTYLFWGNISDFSPGCDAICDCWLTLKSAGNRIVFLSTFHRTTRMISLKSSFAVFGTLSCNPSISFLLYRTFNYYFNCRLTILKFCS